MKIPIRNRSLRTRVVFRDLVTGKPTTYEMERKVVPGIGGMLVQVSREHQPKGRKQGKSV